MHVLDALSRCAPTLANTEPHCWQFWAHLRQWGFVLQPARSNSAAAAQTKPLFCWSTQCSSKRLVSATQAGHVQPCCGQRHECMSMCYGWGGCCSELRPLCGDSVWHLCKLSEHNMFTTQTPQHHHLIIANKGRYHHTPATTSHTTKNLAAAVSATGPSTDGCTGSLCSAAVPKQPPSVSCAAPKSPPFLGDNQHHTRSIYSAPSWRIGTQRPGCQWQTPYNQTKAVTHPFRRQQVPMWA